MKILKFMEMLILSLTLNFLIGFNLHIKVEKIHGINIQPKTREFYFKKINLHNFIYFI